MSDPRLASGFSGRYRAFVGLPKSPLVAELGGFQSRVSSQAMTSPLRCGRLAFHIQLPFSFLHFPYVESAIRYSHMKDFCGNCSFYPNTTHEVRAGVLAEADSVLRHCTSAETILCLVLGMGSRLAAALRCV